MPRETLMQVRRGTAAQWTSANPTLDVGEFGFETDTGKLKIGDGSTAWTSLTYSMDASKVTGATLASNVTASSLTSVGTLGSLSVTGDINIDTNTLKVDSTNNRVGVVTTSPAYPLDVTGTTQSTAFLQGTDYLSPYNGFRNKIINGAFEIWQRGTARTYLNAGSFLADRWTVNQYQNVAHQRVSVTPVSGMQTRYALRAGSSTTGEAGGGSRMWTTSVLESADSIPLRGQTVTLSFWVRFSAATCTSSTATAYGNWGANINFYTSTTDGATVSTGADSQAGTTLTNGSLPTTWTKYTVTGTVPSNVNNVGVHFGFAGLGNTASNDTVWYEITQVQLERGSVATPFEQRPFGTELALCQRYYYSSYATGVAPGANLTASVPTATNALIVLAVTDSFAYITVSQVMRVAPTLTVYSIAGTSGKTSHVGSLTSTSYIDNTTKFTSSTDKGWTISMDESGFSTGWYVLCHYTANAEF